MKTGDKIAKLRKENNLNQDQLASLLKVSRQSVSKWESNISYPETEKLIRISQIFDCFIDYLLNDKILEDKSNSLPQVNVAPNNSPQTSITLSPTKEKRNFALTTTNLITMITILLSFIAFWILFAPIIVAAETSTSLNGPITVSIYHTFNCFESISMLVGTTFFTPLIIIILSVANFILPIVCLIIPKKSKSLNLSLLITSVSTIIFVLLLFAEANIYATGRKITIGGIQGGTFFFSLFAAIIVGLTLSNILIEKYNKNKILHVFNKKRALSKNLAKHLYFYF